jgi:hypothetical protein
MDTISGWFLKQKLGSIGADAAQDSAIQGGAKEARAVVAARRAERVADYEVKKKERAGNKQSVADRWAANKAKN